MKIPKCKMVVTVDYCKSVTLPMLETSLKITKVHPVAPTLWSESPQYPLSLVHVTEFSSIRTGRSQKQISCVFGPWPIGPSKEWVFFLYGFQDAKLVAVRLMFQSEIKLSWNLQYRMPRILQTSFGRASSLVLDDLTHFSHTLLTPTWR